jgi:hypothetical protein
VKAPALEVFRRAAVALARADVEAGREQDGVGDDAGVLPTAERRRTIELMNASARRPRSASTLPHSAHRRAKAGANSDAF